MSACPECLFGVGVLDKTCSYCGAALEPRKVEEAMAERAGALPKPAFQVGPALIPIVLLVGGIGLFVFGAIYSMSLSGGDETTADQATRLTGALTLAAVLTLISLWSLASQRHRYLEENPLMVADAKVDDLDMTAEE